MNNVFKNTGLFRIDLIANGRIRTDDLRITNALLCQLSYVGESEDATKIRLALCYLFKVQSNCTLDCNLLIIYVKTLPFIFFGNSE